MSTIAKLVQRTAPAAPLILGPLNATSLRDQAYALLKNAIADTDIYDPKQELRLDERQLTAALGVSRTPIREALSLLEQEGFIRTIPRRGIYIIRKSKREMIEMIQMWAALESMAARLATLNATDAEIARLRHLFDEFQNSPPSEHLDEYSDANIAFHTAVIALGGSQTIVDATRNHWSNATPSWPNGSPGSTPSTLRHTSNATAISWISAPVDRGYAPNRPCLGLGRPPRYQRLPIRYFTATHGATALTPLCGSALCRDPRNCRLNPG